MSAPAACDTELALMQHSLPHGVFEQSELDGLNLNITVPESTSVRAPLPVFVFVHGGGLSIGCSAWPQYDMANVVRLSAELDQPVIAVTIKYVLHHDGRHQMNVFDQRLAIAPVPWAS